ncbi:MAG TPA: 6-carboxytetrahydropterin synthase QueD [bacterium]|nr:6-carboxytetrahydropterin synthase QueD [bacterium]
MLTTIVKSFTFEAAHRLPNLPTDHKCARLHGHSYRAEVAVTGPVDPTYGWVVDFGMIKDACRPIRDELDHRYLNEISGLENPTSEVIAAWIWQRLAPTLPGLSRVTIHETCTARCDYEGK